MRLSRYGIVLESLGEDHLEMVRLWRNQEFVRCNMEFKEQISREQQEYWFSQLETSKNLYWVIRTHDYPIGLIHIKNIMNVPRVGEAGIFVGEPSYLEMPQPMLAILFMMEIAFLALDFVELRAKIRTGNQHAIAFNKKLGYQLIPGQQSEFKYYNVTAKSFDTATKKLRAQASKMFSATTHVKSLEKPGALASELVKGLTRTDDYFHSVFD